MNIELLKSASIARAAAWVVVVLGGLAGLRWAAPEVYAVLVAALEGMVS
jgi:hypothetical protein